jgi:anthranilate synthase/aminodeoxychorismate synthase-like glutamine amidotransferase
MKVLLLDNYDSFTYNLYDYLLQTGVECVVYRNDALSLADFKQLDFQAMVLSPGPKRPADAGLMMPLIQQFRKRIPILGICLGHQALGESFGAQVVKARVPMHGKTSVIQHQEHPLFEGIPEYFEVMRYHSLLIESLTDTPLRSIAHSAENEIMALEHIALPLLGLQFHPESVLTEFGLQLLKNWVKITKNHLKS